MENLQFIHEWDWKDQPNWQKVQDSINQIIKTGKEVEIYEIDTSGDDYAILITEKSDTLLTLEEVYKVWSDSWDAAERESFLKSIGLTEEQADNLEVRYYDFNDETDDEAISIMSEEYKIGKDIVKLFINWIDG